MDWQALVPVTWFVSRTRMGNNDARVGSSVLEIENHEIGHGEVWTVLCRIHCNNGGQIYGVY